MAEKARTLDEYFAALPTASRRALARLRDVVRSAAPREATEAISYGVPALKYRGRLVGYAAAAGRCSFYVMSGTLLARHEAEVEKYVGGKGTLHFPDDQPLPVALIKRLVKERVAENEARRR